LFDEQRAKVIHNVKNRQGCGYVGGSWEHSGICMMNDVSTFDFDAGWTAPIHGAYLWYEIHDYGEDQRGPIGAIVGCLVKDSEDYPAAPGWCRGIYEKRFRPSKHIGDVVVNTFEELVKDVMELRLKKHGLALIDPSRERIQGLPDQPFIGYPGIIEDFKKENRKKIVPFKIGGGR